MFSRSLTRWTINPTKHFQSRFNSIQLVKTPIEIAQRILCNKLLLDRTILETNNKDRITGTSIMDDDHKQYEMLTKVIEELNLYSITTKRETELMSKEWGSWDMNTDIIPSIQRWESTGVLLWALGHLKMPSHSTRFDIKSILSILNRTPNQNTIINYQNVFLLQNQLISNSKLNDQIMDLEIWFTRAQLHYSVLLAQQTNTRIPQQIQTQHQQMVQELTRQARLREIETGPDDFLVDGILYKDISEDVFDLVYMVGECRLVALGWLVGTHEWDYQPFQFMDSDLISHRF
ncbi:hypothetical protein BC833DRAFT_73973 [Globomyces pollinis-pini]|nr:hypothetical protein BC833DRAFT_73973 [Globomyces pollinis-pini]